MSKRVLLAAAAVALSGCGGYFDQHPANVRPEGEAVVAALKAPNHIVVAQARIPAAETEQTTTPVAPSLPVQESTLAPPKPAPEPPPPMAAPPPKPVEQSEPAQPAVAEVAPPPPVPLYEAPAPTVVRPAPPPAPVAPPPPVAPSVAPMPLAPQVEQPTPRVRGGFSSAATAGSG